jgi:hypothetical protein
MPRFIFGSLVAILICASARAHDLSATARLERGRVLVEAYFDDNTAPRDAHITVADADGHIVSEGHTNEDGKWSFAAPPPGDYQLTIDAGGGHKKIVALTIPGAGGGVISHTSPREEFTGTRWLGLGVGIFLIASFLIVVKLWGKRTRGNKPRGE